MLEYSTVYDYSFEMFSLVVCIIDLEHSCDHATVTLDTTML